MYYLHGISGSSLLGESTDSMILLLPIRRFVYTVIVKFNYKLASTRAMGAPNETKSASYILFRLYMYLIIGARITYNSRA